MHRVYSIVVALDYKFLMFLASGGAPLIWFFYLRLGMILLIH
jgi:hypothetical protein